MEELWYVYPMQHLVSFKLIAERHIEQLRKRYVIQEVDENGFLNIYPYSTPNVVIHPLLYICGKNFNRFMLMRGRLNNVIGVEVADSNMVSPKAVNLCNLCDCIIVPSSFSRDAYVRSGVGVPVEVVPHGLEKHFYLPKQKPIDRKLRYVHSLKQRKGFIYLLYFLWHSSWRKGSDLVYRVLTNVQRERDNVVLVLKSSSLTLGEGLTLDKNRVVLISGWLKEKDLVALYDMCDIYLLFSRGGGFEKNGLEALARGLVVLAPEYGAWTDYLPRDSLVKVARWVEVLPGNEYHIGLGPEIDVEEATDRLLEVIDNLDEWKARYREYAEVARKRYSWDRVGETLIKIVSRYT